MSKNNSCNIHIQLKKSKIRTELEESDRMINLFFKKWKETNLIKDIRNNENYEKPSVTRHNNKRKVVHLKEINEKIILGKLKPRNKRLHQQILNDFKNGKISVRKNQSKKGK